MSVEQRPRLRRSASSGARQMRQHREIVAAQQDRIAGLTTQVRALQRERSRLELRVAAYECCDCPAKSQTIDEHECHPPRNNDPPDIEVFEPR